MKKIFLKYNPYKLETEITVDGKPLADNSKLGEWIVDARLQDWVEDLPEILVDEYNDRGFEVEFHGTLLDYEDLASAFKEAYNKEILTAKLNRIPAKETEDKEGQIAQVFQEIIGDGCPFAELRDPQIEDAFNLAMSDDFEVCVVATMSARKSTLINAMLGTKLMPSKQEACTAIITRIKDEDCDFHAEVYDKSGQLIETHERLTYETMERLNACEDVSEIRIFGKIPFVATDGSTQKKEISLILIDTPGPNNARNPEHGRKQRELLGKSSKALVLYVMTGEFGTEDDNSLIDRVAESMAVKGKQSKDRFIFVVNKQDDRKKEDGGTELTLEKVRSYLKNHKIYNPNLFPAAALPALYIRQMNDPNYNMDVDEQDEIELKIKKLNRNENLYFEKYAPLPPSIRGNINSQLEESRKRWEESGGARNENPEEALIHSGVVSVEAAIRQYVQKYAKTAKIKNLVDTFNHQIEALQFNERVVLAINESEEASKSIAKQIAMIQEKIDSAEEAKRFKDAVDDAVIKVHDEAKEVVVGVVEKFQERITKRIDSVRESELTLNEVEDEVERLTRYARKLEADFKEDMNEFLDDVLVKTGNSLLDEYRKKIASMGGVASEKGSILLEPLKLMSANIPHDLKAENMLKQKEVEDGEEWVENTSKKWYKPWTWFQEKGYYRTKYKTVKFVYANELAQNFFVPLKDNLYENQDIALSHSLKMAKKISENLNKEFKKIDDDLKRRLTDLETLTTDREKAEKRAEKARNNEAWLKDIQSKVDSILEI